MRYKINFLTFLGWLLLTTITVPAQIFTSDTTRIQFAPNKVPDEVTWSQTVSLTGSGLSSAQLPQNMSEELWVQSQPIPAGMSWRPPTSASVKVSVEADAKDFTYLSAYFRYSCDRVHWSTWYNLSSLKAQSGLVSLDYEDRLSIPRLAQDAYYSKMREWWKTDPPWSSDEHELCVWIVGQDPGFFSREFPFIGYVQVRIEGETRGMHIKSMSIRISSVVGGLSSLSKGRVRPTTGEKWFFDVSKIRK